jgi:predicted flap endonuclease-1-like 5' DNA nuclease
MSIEVVLAFIVGLIVGLLIAWFYWRWVAEREEHVRSLQISLKGNETNLLDLKARLQQQEASLGHARSQLAQSERALHDLTAQVQGRDQVIGQLRKAVSEQEAQIRDLTGRMQDAEARKGERLALFPEKEHKLSSLTAEATPPRAAQSLVPETPPQPDDLQRIEGIGPKISAVLQTAGIATFAQLAATDVSRLQQVLVEKRWTFADPATWPEQAGLAAAGDWQALEVLQGELKAGRRV